MSRNFAVRGPGADGHSDSPRVATHVVEGPFDLGAARRALAASLARPEGALFGLALRAAREIHDAALAFVATTLRDGAVLGLTRHHVRLLGYLGAAEAVEEGYAP